MKNLVLSVLALPVIALPAFAGEITKNELSKVTSAVQSWPAESKKAADFMVKKYGAPDGITPNMLVWNNVKPFKRSVVYKEAIIHNFPVEHKDVLEHVVDYESPKAEKVAEIWNFDGSVNLMRTSGEMSARCDREESNILALNLADEIIKGKRSVEEARLQYGKEILSLSEGTPQTLSQSLAFTPANSAAGFTDVNTLNQLKTMQAMEEKVEKDEMNKVNDGSDSQVIEEKQEDKLEE